jgi:hypothetical protein
MEIFTNVDTQKTCEKGGVVTLTLTAAAAQLANHPCRKMWIGAKNGCDVKFAISEAVGAANFGYLPQIAKSDGTVAGEGYLELSLANTNLVQVIGENNDVVYYFWVS